jgi:hypothetical protein
VRGVRGVLGVVGRFTESGLGCCGGGSGGSGGGAGFVGIVGRRELVVDVVVSTEEDMVDPAMPVYVPFPAAAMSLTMPSISRWMSLTRTLLASKVTLPSPVAVRACLRGSSAEVDGALGGCAGGCGKVLPASGSTFRISLMAGLILLLLELPVRARVRRVQDCERDRDLGRDDILPPLLLLELLRRRRELLPLRPPRLPPRPYLVARGHVLEGEDLLNPHVSLSDPQPKGRWSSMPFSTSGSKGSSLVV